MDSRTDYTTNTAQVSDRDVNVCKFHFRPRRRPCATGGDRYQSVDGGLDTASGLQTSVHTCAQAKWYESVPANRRESSDSALTVRQRAVRA